MTDTPTPICTENKDIEHVRTPDEVSKRLEVAEAIADELKGLEFDGSIGDSLVGKYLDGHYEILESLGVGGMGEVYKARHVLMNRVVAIKVLLPHLAQNSHCLRRFQQEAIASARLDHENVCRILEFKSPADAPPYLVMDVVGGIPLSTMISREQMPIARIANIACQVSSALRHAHESGILHRDLKPSNIMVSTSKDCDLVKIVDFGIARILVDAPDSRLTSNGDIIGSPIYMSPEQCRAGDTDYRSDIYSFGCVLYEMITGRPPLRGSTALETIQLHNNKMPESPALTRQDCPQQLVSIVMKCLEKRVEDRFSSTRELHAKLLNFKSTVCLEVDDVESGPQKPRGQKAGNESVRIKLLKVLASALAVIAAVMVSASLLGSQTSRYFIYKGSDVPGTTDDAKPKQPSQYARDKRELAMSYQANGEWRKAAQLYEQLLSDAQSIEARIYYSTRLAVALCTNQVNQRKRGVAYARNATLLANEQYVQSVQTGNTKKLVPDALHVVNCHLALCYCSMQNNDLNGATRALKEAHKFANMHLKDSAGIHKRIADCDISLAKFQRISAVGQSSLHHEW